MIKRLKLKLALLLCPSYFADLKKDIDMTVNQRVAKVVSEMDPFEPLMREFHGIFSKEWEHPESKLNDQGKLTMMMWGYQQCHDPHFKHMTEWIMNTQANETLKRAPVTAERVLYGRAQVSSMILFVKEIGRLSSLYEEYLEKRKGTEEMSELTVE